MIRRPNLPQRNLGEFKTAFVRRWARKIASYLRRMLVPP
jgi:hypothetical protein